MQILETHLWMLVFVQDDKGVKLVSGKEDTGTTFLDFAELPQYVRDFATVYSEDAYIKDGDIRTLEDLRNVVTRAGTGEVLASNVAQFSIQVLTPHTHDWQPTDTEGHRYECDCGRTKVLEAGPAILSAQDLWEAITGGRGESEQDAQARLKKSIYRNTECGAWITFDDAGMHLGSIVEGSDAEVGPYILEYPFTMDEYEETVKDLETEADRMWKAANGRCWSGNMDTVELQDLINGETRECEEKDDEDLIDDDEDPLWPDGWDDDLENWPQDDEEGEDE